MSHADGRDLLPPPHPNADSRRWDSAGKVDALPNGKASVRFLDADGNPLPEGYLVDVTLYPSGLQLPCRVSAAIAGKGEAFYVPWNPGDEVNVVIPDGDERNGGVIIGRHNQALDVFPLLVSGLDVTQNNFGFARLRFPFVVETGSALLVRSAVTGAMLGIDQGGSVTIGAGDGGNLHLGPDFSGIQTPDAAGSVQVVPSNVDHGNQVQLNADACVLLLDGVESTWMSQGTIAIGGAGVPPMGHALTAEQLLGLLATMGFLPATSFATAAAAAIAAAVPNDGGHAAFTAFASTLATQAALAPANIAAGLSAAAGAVLNPAITTALKAAVAVPPAPLAGKFGVACAGTFLG